jgi:phosphoribosylanthranilate isomerase
VSTWIKICGITRLEDARLAVQLGADALGFVMHAQSLRCCNPENARTIIAEVSARVLCVGVWLDEPADQIVTESKYIGCAFIQNYDLATTLELNALSVRCLPAISPQEMLRNEEDIDLLLTSLAKHEINCVIVDSTRRSTSCEEDAYTAQYSESFVRRAKHRAIQSVIAGGLNCGNVRQTLQSFQPFGVDVASGIESLPGVKDPVKLRRFIEEVRTWDEMVTSAPTAADSCRKR